ncbi:GH11682 [Drosophila grimshawi]|uniref:GH11682 n=1 Tax=Drosophila grimshawi TaxID=7222 RepID=B4JCR0_DROGR|nr:GH11682 [Drosophila grimshawi]
MSEKWRVLLCLLLFLLLNALVAAREAKSSAATIRRDTINALIQNRKQQINDETYADDDAHVDADDDFDFDAEDAGYQSDQPVGAITAEKQQAVGTQKNVQESFRQFQDMDYKNNQNIMRILVTLHRSSMETEPLCRLPQPRIIRMDTDPSNTYSPPFTKLHRCDKNSSCCSHLEVWRVKSTAIVELPFFVSPMHGRIGRNMMIPFINHTECHCASSTPQRTKRSNLCQCPKHFTNFGREPDQPIRGTFDPVATSCRCDCHLNDSTCQRMKNGAEGFGIDELRCIRNQECSPPICTYGAFILASGRCPRAPPRPLGFG